MSFNEKEESRPPSLMLLAFVQVMNRQGVILTTYGMVTTRHEDLCRNGSRKFIWDYIILDEGHKIKNPTKTQSAVFGLSAHHRLVTLEVSAKALSHL